MTEKRGWLWPILRGIGISLLVVAMVLLVAALTAFVVACRIVTLPYRSTHAAKDHSKRAQLEALTAMIMAAGALWASLRRGHEFMPKGWHACENPTCQAPIANTSQAKYCSEPCRGYARRRRETDSMSDEIPF